MRPSFTPESVVRLLLLAFAECGPLLVDFAVYPKRHEVSTSAASDVSIHLANPCLSCYTVPCCLLCDWSFMVQCLQSVETLAVSTVGMRAYVGVPCWGVCAAS